jgi:hypothetical protein
MQDLIRFLWDLMHNDQTKSQFERDPHGTLHDCGLSGVTARDVQDAQMIIQDQGIAHPREGSPASAGSDNPVDEIRHTSTYQVDRSTHIDYYNNQQFTVVDIDDRDTLVNDSYNGDTNVVAVQDNDTINHNTDIDVTNVEDSFNDGSADEPATDPSGQSPVDSSDPVGSSDPVTLPAESPDPAADPAADADAATDADADGSADADADADSAAEPEPDPDQEPSSYAPDADGVNAGSEELDPSVV